MNLENIEEKKFSFNKILIFIFFLVLFSNVAVLDYLFFSKTAGERIENKITNSFPQAVVQEKELSEDKVCPSDCIAKINEATSSVKIEVTSYPQVKYEAAPVQKDSVKEFIVTLGSGESTSGDWTDVTGIAAYIDSTKYGKIKKVVFEASVIIPNGNQTAYARLYNATDKHPVWFSDVSLDGGVPKFLVSNPITLDQGSKLYQVQMKTSLKDRAILNQSRIHITVE